MKNFIDNNEFRIFQDHTLLLENIIRQLGMMREKEREKEEQRRMDNFADAFFARKR